MLSEIQTGEKAAKIESGDEKAEGYSSMEIPEPKSEEVEEVTMEAAEEVVEEVVEEAAEEVTEEAKEEEPKH